MTTFWLLILYGWVQALIVLILSFYPNQINMAADSSGLTYNFWPGGQNTFWVCIFLCNITLLQMHNNWTGWGEAIMALCCFSYFLIIYLETLFPMFPNVYRFWDESVSSGSAWLGAFFSLSLLVTVDPMFKAVWGDFLWALLQKKTPSGPFGLFFGKHRGLEVREVDDVNV